MVFQDCVQINSIETRYSEKSKFPLQTKPKLRILYTLRLQTHISGDIS